MNLLYWNLHNNLGIESIICAALEENDVDVFLCSEYKNIDFYKILEANPTYLLLENLDICEKVRIIHKKSVKLDLLKEQHRYILFKIITKNKTYLMTGVHLPANPTSNSDDRKNEIRKIVSDIIEYEKELFQDDNHLSIVIGDMNASPFDPEMINKDSFNCVLFKDVINKQEIIKYNNEPYERFYNPMIDYIREDNQHYGSFYYSSGINSLYWYCYDQILVRKYFTDKIHNVKYLKKIRNIDLVGDVAPIKEISDHLPLLINIGLED